MNGYESGTSCMAVMGGTAWYGHRWRPLLHLINNRLVFETKLTAKPLYPFQCAACQQVVWHNAEAAIALGLVLVPEETP